MTVHDPALHVGQPLRACPCVQVFDHGGRDVGRHDACAEARGRDRERARAGRHVQEPQSCEGSDPTERLLRHAEGERRRHPVEALRYPVPSLADLVGRGHRVLSGHGLLLYVRVFLRAISACGAHSHRSRCRCSSGFSSSSTGSDPVRGLAGPRRRRADFLPGRYACRSAARSARMNASGRSTAGSSAAPSITWSGHPYRSLACSATRSRT